MTHNFDHFSSYNSYPRNQIIEVAYGSLAIVAR